MKNSAYLLIFFLYSSFSKASDAVVIVLEAPLLKKPSLNSVVLQTLRKGQRVYVPNEIATSTQPPEFIQTYDGVGNIAYIPLKYIKIISNDLSESKYPISIGQYDPTDYRLEEPIPPTYPFGNNSFLRANFAFTAGNNMKSPFEYDSNLASQRFSSELGARFNATKKISFDNIDRYYFGLFGAISSSDNSIIFQNQNTATENRSILRLGPIITYDTFKNSHYRLTLGGGFTYNYHKSSISVRDASGTFEQRLFSGYSLAPFLNTYVQRQEVFPGIDLIAGSDVNIYLPHSQKSTDSITYPQFWGNTSSNVIKSGLKTQVSFFLGVQVKH